MNEQWAEKPPALTAAAAVRTYPCMTNLVAFMYHGVGEPADPREGFRYTVTVPEFDAQLNALVDEGVRVVAPDAVGTKTRRLDRAGVVLTFDDGESSVFRIALPRLAARGMRGILFMTTAWLGRRGFLDAYTLRELRAAGWVIGAHGHTHRFLSLLPTSELDDELKKSRDILGDVLGFTPEHLALPGGAGSRTVFARAARTGFHTIWSSVPGPNPIPLSGNVLRRTAIRRGTPTPRFLRLARADTFAHLFDSVSAGVKSGVRRVLGVKRYRAVTGDLLEALGRG